MSTDTRVLVIDDDPKLYGLLSEYLEPHGFGLNHAPDGRKGLTMLKDGTYDVVLLDVMMPGLGGLEVLRRIRTENDIPVLMLTARGDDSDRVVGLELGADEYISKPFNPRVLLAHLRALVRRSAKDVTPNTLVIGELSMDSDRRETRFGGEKIALTGFEFDLLWTLAQHRGKVLSRARLLALAGKDDVVVSDRTVDVHIAHLRKKLGRSETIKTVRGVGYTWVA